MNFFRKHMKVIFIVTVFAFLAGTFVIGFGTSLAADNSGSAVITVEGSKVSLKLFNSLYTNTLEQVRQANPDIQLDETQIRAIKSRVVEELVQTEVFAHQAEKYGIIVSANELKADIENTPIFQVSGAFNKDAYQGFLSTLGITAKEYETIRKKQLLGGKLRMILIPSVKVSPSEFADIARFNPNLTINDYAQVKVNRILNEWFTETMRAYKININEPLLA